MTLDTPGDRSASPSGWEKGLAYAHEYGSYLTLVIGAVLALVAPEPGQNRLVTVGLVVTAAAWVYWTFSRTMERRESQAWMRVYFAGMLAIGAVLILHHPFFFIFPVAGFFQASLLRPVPVTFLGIMLTSMVVNGLILSGGPSAQQLWIYGVVVVVQTLAIGIGVIGSEKLTDLSEARRRAVAELEQALEENRGLHDQLLAQAREAGVSDERQRMAREIHDTIAQGLMGVVTQLEAASGSGHNELERRVGIALRMARESLVEARRAVRAAVPLPLEGRSLGEAIGDVVADWSHLNQVEIEWSATGRAENLHPEIEVTALRVVQEALANVAKHAAASRVGVTLSYMGDVVAVDVRDDGVGFHTNGASSGFGLTAMRSRVEGLEGSIEVESEPGRGTAVSARLPAVPVESADA